MNANQHQVGGNHYKDGDYQLWDFIHDNNIPFLVGSAMKYIHRWRSKNGVQDLEKAKHYLLKCQEKEVGRTGFDWNLANLYIKTVPESDDLMVLLCILEGRFHEALGRIDSVLLPLVDAQYTRG